MPASPPSSPPASPRSSPPPASPPAAARPAPPEPRLPRDGARRPPAAPPQPSPSEPETAGPASAADPTLPADLKAWLADQEKQILVRALEQTGFNRTAAAAKLGLNLRQIRYRMAQLGINDPSAGENDDEGEAEGDEPA
jgi:two-component system response regulator PilR (NtrC family)